MPRRTRLMKILDLVHRDPAGEVIMHRREILNVLHLSGEEFMLGVLFSGTELPAHYYMGLDSRESPSAGDEMPSLEGLEPSGNGYERQQVDAQNFALSVGESGSWQANGPVVSFRASGGSWGAVRNIFLCTGLGYSQPALVSSAYVGQSLTVLDGETITLRMAMSLSGC